MPRRRFHRQRMESANIPKPTAEPMAAIINPDRADQFSRVSVIEHLNFKLHSILLVMVMSRALEKHFNYFGCLN